MNEKITILLSTGNPDKAKELRALLGERFVVQTKSDVGLSDVDIEETGSTLAENACLKVTGLYEALRLAGKDPDAYWILADDTGLFVDALDGRPGIYAARYSGLHATYRDNVEKLLGELSGIPSKNRSAYFKTVIALCRKGVTETVEGVLCGEILETLRGTKGFGYDPVFYVPEEGRALAEMTDDQKNRISHRGRAYRALLDKLRRENHAIQKNKSGENE